MSDILVKNGKLGVNYGAITSRLNYRAILEQIKADPFAESSMIYMAGGAAMAAYLFLTQRERVMSYDLGNALNKLSISNVYLHNLLDGKTLSMLMNTSGSGSPITWYEFASDMAIRDILGVLKVKNAKVLTLVGEKTVSNLLQKNGDKVNVSMAAFLSNVTLGDVIGTSGARGLIANIPMDEIYLTLLGRPGAKSMLEIIKIYEGDKPVHEFLQAMLGDHGLLHTIFKGKTVGDMIIWKDGKYAADVDFISGTQIGHFFDYHYDEVTDAWYEDEAFTIPVSGAAGAIAGIRLNALEDGIANLYLGDIFDLHQDSNGVWYSEWYGEGNENNVKATGVVAAIAGFHLNGIEGQIQGLSVGNVLGWTKAADGKWYEVYDEANPENNVEAKGVMAAFADLTLNDFDNTAVVTNKIKTITLANALGLKKVGDTWYETDANGNVTVAVTPIMGALADYNIANINQAVDNMTLGTIFGYTEEGGVWYTDSTKTTPATGLLKVLANSSIASVTDDLNKLTIGDVIGYTLGEDGKWYDGDVLATGMMVAFAGFTVNDMSNPDKVQEAVKGMNIGDVMGYEEQADGWYDAEGDKLGGIMSVIASNSVGSLPNALDTMTTGQIFDYEDSTATGIFVLIPAGTQVSQMNTQLQASMENATVGQFVDAGIIDLGENAAVLDKLAADYYSPANVNPDVTNWNELTLNEFVNWIIGGMNQIINAFEQMQNAMNPRS